MILVTGGSGFIGSNFIRDWIENSDEPVVNLDAQTYAGRAGNLDELTSHPNYRLVAGDICDPKLVRELFAANRPQAIVHFAAESHVDRSISGPQEFIRTNINGTFNLLQAGLEHWRTLNSADQSQFRFLHVSTDEVYGSLSETDPAFSENTPYAPNSPYSASKASSDFLVRAWFHTYGFPVLTTNCSNNYGPFQFPEKLIPLTITNALAGQRLPVYGDGKNVRDWLFVSDHCTAIRLVLQRGRLGETYNIGGKNEIRNIDIVRSICGLLDESRPDASGPHDRLIEFVTDRPGHDQRYAVDIQKISTELGWSPAESFQTGIRKTVQWYLAQTGWVSRARQVMQAEKNVR
jgi:dTDP-glucose 4,6-dehydratase